MFLLINGALGWNMTNACSDYDTFSQWESDRGFQVTVTLTGMGYFVAAIAVMVAYFKNPNRFEHVREMFHTE